MKKIFILSLFALLSMQAKATECSGRIFQEEKINLYFCQNHSNFSETRALLFKAKTKVLNDYIKDKIAKGELEDKKFEIQIYDQILTHIFVVQNMQIIKSIKVEFGIYEDFNVYLYPKWVNICWGGTDNWLYGYSYENNSFYKNEKLTNQ